MSKPLPTDTLASADGIRGLACLIVLLLHASVFWTDSSAQLRGAAKYGVWLFFVLSAFLLTLRVTQRDFNAHRLVDYALGRSLRILPLFAIACLIYYIAGIGIETSEQLFNALTFKQGFIHLWTIPVEFGFYLILPPLAWGARTVQRRYGDATLMLAALALLLAQQWLWPYWETPTDSPNTRWYLPSFILGAMAALLLPRFRQLPREHLATPVVLICLATLVLAIPGVRQTLFGTPLTDYLVNKHLFIALLWTVVIGLTVDGHGLIGRLLCHRVTGLLGRFSYSIYLFHWLVLVLFSRQWPGQPMALIAALIVVLGCGAMGYHLIEQPLEELRKYLSSRKRPVSLTQP